MGDSTKMQIVRSAPAQSKLQLLDHLSYTHFEQLVSIENSEKRDYYQTECIRGSWSVRELKRQINSLLFERSVLSVDHPKLIKQTNKSTEKSSTAISIRDPYVFEFLGLTPTEVMSESHLEDQLLDRIQVFLLELGQGFCFESRQRRILIGNSYNFVDLVFYHRILKCHVLVELKLEAFSHENIGQLNTYVSWYEKNVRASDDNPPVGILLCTEKDHALVEYALAGMDNSLFVSRYQLELPSRETLQKTIEKERLEIESKAS
jgi:predicted nuclease of restriction endonuclease-like (RecB) superfamily